jgi:hypothetical protein
MIVMNRIISDIDREWLDVKVMDFDIKEKIFDNSENKEINDD